MTPTPRRRPRHVTARPAPSRRAPFGGRLAAAALLLGLALTAAGCRLRAPIPQPRTPLAATPAEALPDRPAETLDEAPFRLRLVRRELNNGLSVLISRGAPHGVVSVAFVDRAAAAWDARAPEPLTRLMASAMFRATETDAGVVDDLLEREGFSPEVELRAAGLVITDRILFEELPRYLDGLDRALRRPVYRPEDLRLVLDARTERLAAHVLTPDGLIADRVPSLLYREGDPRAVSIRDRLEVLGGVESEALARRHAQVLDPSRCAIVIAGDVEPLGALRLIGERFGAWPRHDSAPEIEAPRYREAGPRGLVIVQPLVRTYLKLVERAPPLGHEDHAAFRILEQLLGGMFGARLNLALREERGISYGFHARYDASATEGELELVTAIDPDHAGPVADAILAELRRVRGEEGAGLEALELELAKTRARERLLVDLDTSAGLARTLAGYWLAERDPMEVSTVLARIDALDAEAVQAAARRWIRPDRAPLVAVGRRGVVDALRGVGAGELEVLEAPERRRR
jgi:zinc protease